MKILKFGGSSLANGEGIILSLDIIKKAAAEQIAVVVSARGKATDKLEEMLDLACNTHDYKPALENFFKYQLESNHGISLDEEYQQLDSILKAISLLGDYSPVTKDKVLAFGELISAKTIVSRLKKAGVPAVFVDSRQLIKTNQTKLDALVNHEVSQRLVQQYFAELQEDAVAVVTGFIASDMHGNTTSLGRNGSNYTATLLASYCGATEVQNWTNIDGIYTANPALVNHAQKIPCLSYREANELAHFGANILHAKTILPLIEKEIPIRILNTFKPKNDGTTINAKGSGQGIKAVSVIEDVSLVSIEGRGLMGKVGIDARIFNVLSQKEISVRMISQASSERGIGFIVNQQDAATAKETLEKEFDTELNKRDISSIKVNSDLAIIAIIGRHNYALEKAISGLRKNKIWMYLINNSSNGEQISLVVANNDLKKAANVVHNQVFGALKTLHVVAFGKGTVGGTFMDQLVGTREDIIRERKLKISLVGIADSRNFCFKPEGLGVEWRRALEQANNPNDPATIINLIDEAHLENVVLVDNTASEDLVKHYPDFVRAGFDMIASNKIANSLSFDFYKSLRKLLKQKNRSFFYETNVGAGLPLIDTLKLLHLSGENIRKIRGVFSGSLSYIFNTFSEAKTSFSEVLYEVKSLGLTEPDPREDLSGMDVARKLLILAREIGMSCDIHDVEVEDLIPESLQAIVTWEEFESHLDQLNQHYNERMESKNPNKVFRYVGELDREQGLRVALISEDRNSGLGAISGADSIFEIYTEAYGDQPIIIQGAGAGAAVTARGVYSDLLRLGSKI